MNKFEKQYNLNPNTDNWWYFYFSRKSFRDLFFCTDKNGNVLDLGEESVNYTLKELNLIENYWKNGRKR